LGVPGVMGLLAGGLASGFVLATLLNILIKLMTMVSVVFTPVVIKFSPIIQEWLHIAPR